MTSSRFFSKQCSGKSHVDHPAPSGGQNSLPHQSRNRAIDAQLLFSPQTRCLVKKCPRRRKRKWKPKADMPLQVNALLHPLRRFHKYLALLGEFVTWRLSLTQAITALYRRRPLLAFLYFPALWTCDKFEVFSACVVGARRWRGLHSCPLVDEAKVYVDIHERWGWSSCTTDSTKREGVDLVPWSWPPSCPRSAERKPKGLGQHRSCSQSKALLKDTWAGRLLIASSMKTGWTPRPKLLVLETTPTASFFSSEVNATWLRLSVQKCKHELQKGYLKKRFKCHRDLAALGFSGSQFPSHEGPNDSHVSLLQWRQEGWG